MASITIDGAALAEEMMLGTMEPSSDRLTLGCEFLDSRPNFPGLVGSVLISSP